MIRRRLLLIASLVSLLMFVATVVLWVLSYVYPCGVYGGRDRFDGTIRDGQQNVQLSASRGGVHVWLRDERHDGPRTTFLTQLRNNDWGLDFEEVSGEYPAPVNPLKVTLGFAGCFACESSAKSVNREIELIAPLWCIALISAVLPVIGWRRLRRARGKGMCSSCGYNLTGNTSGVCPECGTPVPQNQKSIL